MLNEGWALWNSDNICEYYQDVCTARAAGGGQAQHQVHADLFQTELNHWRHFQHAFVPVLLLPGRPGYIHCDQLALSFIFM